MDDRPIKPPEKLSRKARAFLDRYRAVKDLYSRVSNLKQEKEYLTPTEAQALGIQFSSLDLLGEKAATSYFHPGSEEKYRISQSGITFDRFLEFPKGSPGFEDDFLWLYKDRSEIGIARDRFGNLVNVYTEYGGALWEKFEHDADTLMGVDGKQGEVASIARGRNITSIIGAKEFMGGKRPHRALVLKSTTFAADTNYRALINELEMALSWIEGACRTQVYEMCKRNVSDSELHVVFPILIVSFFMPTHARIIQGFFDGKLKIQLSKFYNFDKPNDKLAYTKLMDTFLTWAAPTIRGNTMEE